MSQALRLQLTLNKAGYDVRVAHSGVEGLEFAHMTNPAVILLDINLPVMDGFEVLSQIKQTDTTRHIPVVMLTSLDSIKDVERAVSLGADGYLFKDDCLGNPNGVQQILDTIHEVIQIRTTATEQSMPSVLLIEDSPSQALRLKLFLEKTGYDNVRVARNGAEGWHQAKTTPPTIILLDINLPIMDGFTVLSKLKQHHLTAHIPVIMLTSQDRIDSVEEAVALGADGYLFKDDCLFRQDGTQQIVYTMEQIVTGKS
jgi:CheY-like chemotaxis protein